MVLSDGSLAVAECLEEDDWECAAEASEPSNMPQNASEDTGCPALSMPLSQLLSAEDAADLELMHTRWLGCLSLLLPHQTKPGQTDHSGHCKYGGLRFPHCLFCIVRNPGLLL